MPAISLVVCLYRERDLLERLLRETAGCFDDLVVVHDGPDTTGARGLVKGTGGRFFERPRAFQQEPHWPFAWGQARHDWILRLDADEFPSSELKAWLRNFRPQPEPSAAISGFTCIWPLWDGKKAVTHQWPRGRLFLFNKQKVRFFGVVEASPLPDGHWEETGLVLQHRPRRKSYGVRNILFRRQAYEWRRVIAESLMAPPTKLPCWRWELESWPDWWESLRRTPLRESVRRLIRLPLCQARDMFRAGENFRPSACLNPGLHYLMLGLRVYLEKRKRSNNNL